MPPPPTRRRFLQLAGTAAATGLAGCSRTGGSTGQPPVTPAPVPSDRPTTTPRADATVSGPTAEDLAFDVALESGFSVESPARLEIAVRNDGDGVLTAVGGPDHVLPFVDDDYVGVDRTGHPTLFLAPDDAGLTIAPAAGDPGPLGEFLPAAPVEGCWSVPFDWPAAWGPQPAILRTDSLDPGETRRHGYGLYYLEACVAGTFAFASTFELTSAEPPFGGPATRARLGFVVTVTGDLEVLVGVQDPVVEPPSSRDD